MSGWSGDFEDAPGRPFSRAASELVIAAGRLGASEPDAAPEDLRRALLRVSRALRFVARACEHVEGSDALHEAIRQLDGAARCLQDEAGPDN